MDHQKEIEKKKYRNWVRGGLAYKYLKQGLENFADDVVKREHTRILASINNTAHTNCNFCLLQNLQPLHTCKKGHNGQKICPYELFNCNCVHSKKQPCPSSICDGVMEEILKSHGSLPTQPNWKNTDIKKWCTEPWEVAKCYINAPGYADKKNAADIDASGLLHVFINNTNLHSHLACSMTGNTNIFIKTRARRNSIFHSPSMEMEDKELNECVDDIIAILEDAKEIKTRDDAQKAVTKLKKLRYDDFVITTHNELEVCREALSTVTRMTVELNQLIQKTKVDIDTKQASASKAIDSKIQTVLQDAAEALANNGELKEVEQAIKVLNTNVDNSERNFKQRLIQIENDIATLKASGDQQKTKERLKYLEDKQKLQGELVKYYQKYFLKTSVSPLKQEEDNIKVKDVYVPPEIEVIEEKHFDNRDKIKQKTPEKKYVKRYQEIFQTKKQQNKKIYIVGDVGTGKSFFCKIMIENWCEAVNVASRKEIGDEIIHISSEIDIYSKCDDDVNQMGQYEFLFFLPLQYVSAFKSDVAVDMIKELARNLTSNTELIDKLFEKDSQSCLIIFDGLDEWIAPQSKRFAPHVSYGIPNVDLARDATVITLSRPSAKGILNLKDSEVDLKLQLLGISYESLNSFIERYISNMTGKSYSQFITSVTSKQIKHIEKTPLLLQQLLWLYCNGTDLGESVSETYCQILNTMFGWTDHKAKGRDNDARQNKRDNENVCLPVMLQRFPRLKNNLVLFRLGKIAYETFTSDIQATSGISCLIKNDLSDFDINELTRFGILNEISCFDPTLDDTQLAFIHISYLEFFAAIYITTCHNMELFASIEHNREVSVLDKFFGTCQSASDVLQLSNVIKMVCGLSPGLLCDLSERISSIVNTDGQILRLRRNQNIGWNDEIVQIQNLIENCLQESGSDDTTMISLSDLKIKYYKPFPRIQRIKPGDVISLTIDLEETLSEIFDEINHFNCIKYLKDFTEQCKQVQYMRIDLGPSEKNEKFPFSFSEKVALKQLMLCGVNNCDINLSMQNQLQILDLTDCHDIHISHLNTEKLERVHFKSCKFTSDLDCLLNANKLTDLNLEWHSGNLLSLPSVLQQAPYRQLVLDIVNCDQCSVHNIDLSRHNHLQQLKVVGCSCDTRIPVLEFNISPNTSKLVKLYLRGVTANIASLVSLIQQAPLTQLTLVQVSDQHSDVESPILDVSRDHNCNESHTIGVSNDKYVDKDPTIFVYDGQSDLQGHLSVVSNDQFVDEGHIRVVSDDQSSDDSYMTCVSDIQSIDGDDKSWANNDHFLDEEVKFDSDDELVDVGHAGQLLRIISVIYLIIRLPMKVISDIYLMINLFIKSLTRGESDEHHDYEGHTSDVSDNQSVAESHSKFVRNDQSVDEGHSKFVSDDQAEDECYMRNISYNQFSYEGPIRGVYEDDFVEESQTKFVSDDKSFDEGRSKSVSDDHIIRISDDQSDNKAPLIGVSNQIVGKGSVYVINLSKHNELRELKIDHCGKIGISNINTEQLEHLYIDYSKVDFSSSFTLPVLDFNILPNVSKLIELRLQGLTVNMASLVLLLQQSPLRQLTLISVSDGPSVAKGHVHVTDLSKQNQLRELKMEHCDQIRICNINTEQLEYVNIHDSNLNFLSGTCIPVLDLNSFNGHKDLELHLEVVTVNEGSLVTLLQQTNLRQLTLTRVYGDQYDAGGKMHVIQVDLSKQNNLQILKLSHCKNIKITHLNTEQLKHVHIIDNTTILDFGLLSNASRLTKLYVEHHIGELTSLPLELQQEPFRQLTFESVEFDQDEHQRHLQKHKIIKCCVTMNKGINNDQITQVYIENGLLHYSSIPVLQYIISVNKSKLIDLYVKDVNCDNSSIAPLIQHTSIRQLTLTRVSGDQLGIEGHMHEVHLDLSKQKELQKLELTSCKNIKITELNTEKLEELHIEHCPGMVEFDLLVNANKLIKLSSQDNKDRYTKQVDKVMHTLHHLRELKLLNVDIDDNALTVTTEMKSLAKFEIKDTTMSLGTWRIFADSILTLHQPVFIHARSTEEEKREFVRTHPKFEVMRDWIYFFDFRSRK